MELDYEDLSEEERRQIRTALFDYWICKEWEERFKDCHDHGPGYEGIHGIGCNHLEEQEEEWNSD